MSKTAVLAVAGAAIGGAMFAFGFVAGTQPETVNAGPSRAMAPRAEVEAIVRDYLTANPEILIEMQTALETKHEEQQRVAQVDTIRAASDDIFNADYDGIVGNPEGNVTIVEFFDYNCGFCKRAMDDMDAMVENDPELRFVLKEFPILGPDSQRAHMVSMAFHRLAPESYAEFHRQLLGGSRATEDAAIAVAQGLGVDEAALRQEMMNPDIAAAFETTYDIANRLSITGTPSYVVGDEVVFGALGQAVLEEKIELIRATN
ncbi:DsbA family protein [Mesorhizobium sp. CAU 1741]|uniref:DsbA family protein n=1 Tax=Mesorhizobium sp. CAU 1741 TaxID=3140366 RepID=UPI00325AE948